LPILLETSSCGCCQRSAAASVSTDIHAALQTATATQHSQENAVKLNPILQLYKSISGVTTGVVSQAL